MKNKFTYLLFFILLPLLAQSQFTRFQQIYDYGLAESAYDAQQTTDGGYVLVGRQGIAIGQARIVVTKTDSLGQEEWHRFYGNQFGNEAYAIRQTADEGYVVAGYTTGDEIHISNADIYILRLAPNGDTLWTNTYGGPDFDWPWDLEITPDNGFIVCGGTTPSDSTRINGYLLKVNSLGDLEWERSYTTPGNWEEQFFGVEVLADGGYALAGQRNMGLDGSFDVWLLRIDSMGDTLWTKTYGGEMAELVYDLKPTKDAGFIIAGGTASFGPSFTYDVLLIKTDSEGDTLWTKVMSNGERSCYANAITPIKEGGYVFGITDYNSEVSHNTILVNIDESGEVLWAEEYETPDSEFARSIISCTDGGYAIGGGTSNFTTPSMFLLKTDKLGRLITSIKPPPQEDPEFAIYPNPSSGIVNCRLGNLFNQNSSLLIVDPLGRVLQKILWPQNSLEYSLDLSGYPDGIYYLQIHNERGLGLTQKLMLLQE